MGLNVERPLNRSWRLSGRIARSSCVRAAPVGGCARGADGLGIQRARQDLGDVLHGEVLLRADAFDTVFEHGDAERAGGRHRVGAGGQRLLDARIVDALADLLLHPDTPAAAATAEGAIAIAAQHAHALTVDALEYRARLVRDAV